MHNGNDSASVGLTVRDHMAVLAMEKLLETKPTATAADRRSIAVRAYELADAMPEARGKGL